MRATNPAPAAPLELLTIEAAAERISMSARHLRRLVAERQIASYHLGRAVRISPADLDAYITAGRVEPITRTTVYTDLRRVS
jgi:excisionase family DNA binding protein